LFDRTKYLKMDLFFWGHVTGLEKNRLRSGLDANYSGRPVLWQSIFLGGVFGRCWQFDTAIGDRTADAIQWSVTYRGGHQQVDQSFRPVAGSARRASGRQSVPYGHAAAVPFPGFTARKRPLNQSTERCSWWRNLHPFYDTPKIPSVKHGR
jgi:hypothetical protein